MRVLTVNVGSTSVKLAVVADGDQVTASIELHGGVGPGQLAEGLERLDNEGRAGSGRAGDAVDASVHRIVHGGSNFHGPVIVDDDVERKLRALADLAPLHQTPAVDALATVRRLRPGVPAVACFDTAFHASMPAAASTYAVPRAWREAGMRRYGFHGLSHAWAARQGALLCDRPIEDLRVVTCHLGGGASLAAVGGGRSLDTTMGFTPVDGLVMATRSGSVDPAAVLWLQTHRGLAPDAVADALERDSGLAGLAGTADLRAVLDRARGGDRDATLAVDVYLHRLRAGIAAMTAALEGLDVLVFTGGAGEHSAEIRGRAAAGLGYLGIGVHEGGNAAARPDCEISAPDATVRTFVVVAREDLEMAHGARTLLGGG